MTEPNETNEEINEELSTDDLKAVSGGINLPRGPYANPNPSVSSSFVYNEPNPGSSPMGFVDPKGSGYAGTLKDWKRANKVDIDRGAIRTE
ncbi:hypothetical protein [Prochlorococcus sp. MIT 1201]|uniref:hypothetical protein n=1 Tax=Prochlorococcus sp. MIT 1201 TaxID=3082535 RepID=UPI0039A435F3